MGNSAGRDVRRADRAVRDNRALELRRTGLTYAQIAKELAYSGRPAVHKAIHRAIRRIGHEPAKHVVSLELERLNQLLLGVWNKAKSGDPQAVDRALRILERRSAYLGLDAPKRTAATVGADVAVRDDAHEQLMARIAVVIAEHIQG